MRPLLTAALIVIAATGSALADPAPATTQPETASKQVGASARDLAAGGRYQLMEVNDKVVRLDTQTGRFELCSLHGENWSCVVAEDERDRLNAVIADLSKRVAALEAARRTETAAAPAIGRTPLPAPRTAAASPSPAAASPAPAPAAPAAAAATPASAVPVAGATPTGPVPQVPVEPRAGKPVDISPAATTSAEEENARPGILQRLADRIGHIGW